MTSQKWKEMTLDNILLFSEHVLDVFCTGCLISGNTLLILLSNRYWESRLVPGLVSHTLALADSKLYILKKWWFFFFLLTIGHIST